MVYRSNSDGYRHGWNQRECQNSVRGGGFLRKLPRFPIQNSNLRILRQNKLFSLIQSQVYVFGFFFHLSNGVLFFCFTKSFKLQDASWKQVACIYKAVTFWLQRIDPAQLTQFEFIQSGRGKLSESQVLHYSGSNRPSLALILNYLVGSQDALYP